MKLFVETFASKYCKSKLQRSITIYHVASQEYKWHPVIVDHFDLQVEVHL